jgi:hypothetical protein
MLTKDPRKRASLQQVLQHAWLRTPPSYVTSNRQNQKQKDFTKIPKHLQSEEEVSLKSGIHTIDEKDMFMSISGVDISKDDNTVDDVVTSNDDIMATNWGGDEFEMVPSVICDMCCDVM